jgi:hypothetical protein
MRVFENALAFNAETTHIAQTSLKLIAVFERLMYEIVLSTQHSMSVSDNCLACRSTYAEDEGRTVLCDRCEAYYHMDCLSPPLATAPRGEWFCPACIEQRDVSFCHPLRFAFRPLTLC